MISSRYELVLNTDYELALSLHADRPLGIDAVYISHVVWKEDQEAEDKAIESPKR